MSIKVKKRDGRIEELDITKIQKYTKDAVAGLNNVDQSELEVDANLQFYDGINTNDIQNTLINTAVSKIDIDRPDWTFVAARLFLYDMYHKVPYNSYNHIKEYIEVAKNEGRLFQGFYDKYDLNDLNNAIKPERDLQFNYLGIRTLYDRYLIKNRHSELIELPQHMFMGIAMFLAQNEENPQYWAKQFYEVISKFEFMPATPTLSNARTTRHQLSSCYIGSSDDNIEGIFDSYSEISLLSKFGGGIGWDFSKVRAQGSHIDNHKNAAGGTIPFLKIANDIAVAVDQLGTRKGAIAVYMEPWHLDVLDFLDLRKNSGEERRRAHDLFPALWINDLFMQRVEEDGNWTLLDPHEAIGLTEVYGEEFNRLYTQYENKKNIRKEIVKAKELWKKILLTYYETGSPFLTFKDSANRVNPNAHVGIIRSSNLCTEIFQNTKPNHYKTLVEFEDGSKVAYEEDDVVTTDNSGKKLASKITSLDVINGKKVYIVTKERINGNTAVCNLGSINLSKVNTKENIERVVPIAIRMLDNVIDLNFYPVKKVKDTNLKTRAIGLGVMGEAELLAKKNIEWGSESHLNTIDEIMETISYNAISTSNLLASEKGIYPQYEGSNWSKGVLPIDFVKDSVKTLTNRGLLANIYDWDSLREKLKINGMRNGYLMSIAPTSSISILVGTTASIEPIYKKKWYEENLSGLIPVTAPSLSLENFNYYVSSYDIDQTILIKAGAVRQKWIDQGQSLNIFIPTQIAKGALLNDIYTLAWRLGLKSTYYLRSQSFESSVVNRGLECLSCQ